MSNYKQKLIPVVDDNLFEGLKLGQIKEYVKQYFNQFLRNTSAINAHKGVTVKFSRKGLDHLIHSRNVGYLKLKAIIVLREMVENAVYLNFKNKDMDDNEDIFGYFNFKSKAKIEGKIQTFRIVVRLTKDGKFYYDHAIRVRK